MDEAGLWAVDAIQNVVEAVAKHDNGVALIADFVRCPCFDRMVINPLHPSRQRCTTDGWCTGFQSVSVTLPPLPVCGERCTTMSLLRNLPPPSVPNCFTFKACEHLDLEEPAADGFEGMVVTNDEEVSGAANAWSASIGEVAMEAS